MGPAPVAAGLREAALKAVWEPDTSCDVKGHECLGYLFQVLKDNLALQCFANRDTICRNNENALAVDLLWLSI